MAKDAAGLLMLGNFIPLKALFVLVHALRIGALFSPPPHFLSHFHPAHVKHLGFTLASTDLIQAHLFLVQMSFCFLSCPGNDRRPRMRPGSSIPCLALLHPLTQLLKPGIKREGSMVTNDALVSIESESRKVYLAPIHLRTSRHSCGLFRFWQEGARRGWREGRVEAIHTAKA
jgi:hypothetical protein